MIPYIVIHISWKTVLKTVKFVNLYRNLTPYIIINSKRKGKNLKRFFVNHHYRRLTIIDGKEKKISRLDISSFVSSEVGKRIRSVNNV